MGAAGVWAETGFYVEKDLAEPRVQWDYGIFGAPPDGPFRLEVYYKIFNDGLTYRKQNGSYLASYQIEVIIYQDDDQVAGTTFKEDYPVESFPRTLSQTDFLLNQLNLTLDRPGDFEVVFRLRDLKSNQVSETRKKFKIPTGHNTWEVSSVEFARLIEPAEDTSQFNKAGWLVVPSVSRSYGGTDNLDIPIYAEVYGDSAGRGTPLAFAVRVIDPLGDRASDTTIDFTSGGRVTQVISSIPVSTLAPGNYRMEFELIAGQNRKSILDLTETFRIGWSMATLIRNDFKTAVEQLKYIATDKERDSLLAAPDSLRAKTWEQFWKKRDPTPGTPMNEFRDEYYRRIRYANAAFTVSNVLGWRTDRGMIYIQFGEPDEVERHPFELDDNAYNAPWQVWYYYSADRRFVFVDRRGSGDYELQYPYDGDPWKSY